jgi:hypothetical protein
MTILKELPEEIYINHVKKELFFSIQRHSIFSPSHRDKEKGNTS